MPLWRSVKVQYALMAFLFGSSYTALNYSNQAIAPSTMVFTMVAIRLMLASALFLIFALFPCKAVTNIFADRNWAKARTTRFSRYTALQLMALGFVNLTLPYALMRIASQCLSSGLVCVLQSTKPALTQFIALLAMGDTRPMHWLRPLGIAIGLTGTTILSLHRISYLDDECAEQSSGFVLLVVLSAAMQSLCAVLTQLHLSHISAFELAAGQTFGAAVAAMLLSLSMDYAASNVGYEPFIEQLSETRWVVFACLLYAGVGSTCVGWFLFFGVNRAMGPVKQMTSVYLEVLVAVVQGALFLGDASTLSLIEVFIGVIGALMSGLAVFTCIYSEPNTFAFSTPTTPLDSTSPPSRSPSPAAHTTTAHTNRQANGSTSDGEGGSGDESMPLLGGISDSGLRSRPNAQKS